MALPKNFVRQFVICVALSIAGYGAWVVFTDAEKVWASVLQLGWAGWLIILGLSLFNYMLRFLHP